MFRPAAAFAIAIAGVVGWAGADAAPMRLPLGKATILYDTAIWRALVSDGAISFTCIAPDCTGQPRVFANVTTARDLAQRTAAAQHDSRRLRDDGVPSIPFPALAYWSGCRAQDAPILFSGGQVGDVAYAFVTAITAGCNFNPPMPEARFVELLRGFETN
jgi:hypothetical protein